MNTHKLKCRPEYFKYILQEAKSFENRKNDRGYKLGDRLELAEYLPDQNTFTGWYALARVTYILQGEEFGMIPGYVTMAIRLERIGHYTMPAEELVNPVDQYLKNYYESNPQ